MSKKIKIIHIIGKLDYGGAERLLLDICRKIDKKKFDVSVEHVRTIKVKGKQKKMNTRRGITRGRTPNWKKAVVTLREGDSIDYFEGTSG